MLTYLNIKSRFIRITAICHRLWKKILNQISLADSLSALLFTHGEEMHPSNFFRSEAASLLFNSVNIPTHFFYGEKIKIITTNYISSRKKNQSLGLRQDVKVFFGEIFGEISICKHSRIMCVKHWTWIASVDLWNIVM